MSRLMIIRMDVHTHDAHQAHRACCACGFLCFPDQACWKGFQLSLKVMRCCGLADRFTRNRPSGSPGMCWPVPPPCGSSFPTRIVKKMHWRYELSKHGRGVKKCFGDMSGQQNELLIRCYTIVKNARGCFKVTANVLRCHKGAKNILVVLSHPICIKVS